MKRILSALLAVVLILMIGTSATLAATDVNTFPKIIPIPDGFYPEGIAVGRGTDFFVGSLLDGDIYRGDLRTGEGSVLVQKEVQDGDIAVGLAVDRRTNYLFVAGGFGTARVYNAGTGGNPVAVYQLTTESFPSTLVNDVTVTRDAAYFTDSFRPFIYRIPLGTGGALPNSSAVEEIPLGGDFIHVPGDINSNGIVATPDGERLIICNTSTGSLYLVDPETGSASQIDLGGGGLPSGSADGLLLDGKTLYVVQNFLNQISAVRLASDHASGEVIDTITDAAFAVPVTIAEFGSSIYAINARFDMGFPPFFGGPLHDPPLEYDVVKVPKH
jgi:sugar lactone lactonase YvrE